MEEDKSLIEQARLRLESLRSSQVSPSGHLSPVGQDEHPRGDPRRWPSRADSIEGPPVHAPHASQPGAYAPKAGAVEPGVAPHKTHIAAAAGLAVALVATVRRHHKAMLTIWLLALALIVIASCVLTVGTTRLTIDATGEAHTAEPSPLPPASVADVASRWLGVSERDDKKASLALRTSGCLVGSGSAMGPVVEIRHVCFGSWPTQTSLATRLSESLQALAPPPLHVRVLAATVDSTFAVSVRAAVLGGLITLLVPLISLATYLLSYYLSDQLRYSQEVTAITGAPVAVSIARMRKDRRDLWNALCREKDRDHAFDILRALIIGSSPQGPITIAVTSGTEGDGKSTIAANLAASCAAAGLYTVLVDGDIRRRTLTRSASLEYEPGLLDQLALLQMKRRGGVVKDTGAVEWSQRIPQEHLRVLPAGHFGHRGYAALEAGIGQVLARIRSQADVTIVDCPPLLLTSEAIAYAKHCDRVLLVASLGVTRRASLARTADLLGQIGCKSVIAALNQRLGKPGQYVKGGYLTLGYGSTEDEDLGKVRSARPSFHG